MAAKINADKRFEIYANIVALMELRHSKSVTLSETARSSIADNAYVAATMYTDKFNEKELKDKKKLISKVNVSESETNYIALFEKARAAYPGTKRGSITEYTNFRKKHADFRLVAKALYVAVINQKNHKEYLKSRTNEFVPSWPNFSTWINGRRWEEYINSTDRTINPVAKPKAEKFL